MIITVGQRLHLFVSALHIDSMCAFHLNGVGAGWQTTFSLILAAAFWAQRSCREKQWPFWRSSSGAVGGRACREAQQARSSRQESWNKQKGLLTAEKRLRSRDRYMGVSIGAWRGALNYIHFSKLLKLASVEGKIE